MIEIEGHRALVTGAMGTGFGREIADELEGLGAEVIRHGRREGDATGDLADPGVCRVLAARVGPVSILINNAAETAASLARVGATEDTDRWDRTMAVNLRAPWLLAELLAAQGGLRVVVNVSSIYGVVARQTSLYPEGMPASDPAYAAGKAGLLQLTRYHAVTLAPIRVNAVVPGGLERGQDPEFVRRYERRCPQGRMVQPGELGPTVAWLCSEGAKAITGQAIHVDGGWTIW